VSPTGPHLQGHSCTGVLLPGQWRWETGLQATTAPPTHRPCATAGASARFWGAASAASSGRSLGASVLPGLGPRGTARSSGHRTRWPPGGLWGQQGILETGRTVVSVLCQVSMGKGGEKATKATAIHTETGVCAMKHRFHKPRGTNNSGKQLHVYTLAAFSLTGQWARAEYLRES